MSRTLATLSLIATVASVLIVALHFTSPEMNPMLLGISFYALGQYGALLAIALILVGLAGMALAFSLLPQLPSSGGRAGLVLLALWGIASILAGFFPVDAPGATPTLSGTIHNFAGMNFLLIVPALLLIELQRSRAGSVQRPRATTYWLVWIVPLAAISLFVFNGPLYGLHFGGAFQRLYWVALVLWLFLKGVGIRSTAAAYAS